MNDLKFQIRDEISRQIMRFRGLRVIIFPFGECGKIAKDILNNEFGIKEYLLLDNFGGVGDIHPLDYLKTHTVDTETVILLAVIDIALRMDLKSKLCQYTTGEQIVELDIVPVETVREIRFEIKYQILSGKSKFFIYADGRFKHIVKHILNDEFSINELGFIGDKGEDGVYPINHLNMYKEDHSVYVMFTSERFHPLRQRQKCKICQYVSDRQLIDVWDDYNFFAAGFLHNKAKMIHMDEEKRMFAMKSKNVVFWLPRYDSDFIQKSIFMTDAYFEEELLYYVTHTFKNGEVLDKIESGTVLDVGANIGNHSLYYALECRATQVYSFEPVAETYEILKKNISLNDLENKVTALNVAVGEKRSRGVVKESCWDNIGGTRIGESDVGDFDIVQIDEFKLNSVVLMKVDVEGFEVNVLRGALDTIARCSPFIVLESLGESIYEIINMLSPIGYHWEKISSYDYLFYPIDQRGVR